MIQLPIGYQSFLEETDDFHILKYSDYFPSNCCSNTVDFVFLLSILEI
jgi:hypothetical protein